MALVVFAVVAALAVQQQSSAELPYAMLPLALLAAIMSVAVVYATRQMKRTTAAMEIFQVEVLPGELHVGAVEGKVVLKEHDIDQVIAYNTLLPPRLTYCVVGLRNGQSGLIPPLEQGSMFIAELHSLMPSLQVKRRYRLIAAL